MANQDETNNPVQVIVTNINDPKQSLENVRKESEKVYKLLNGRDYKEVIKDLKTKQDSISTKVQGIEKLLVEIKQSIIQISSKPSSPTSTNPQPTPYTPTHNPSSSDNDEKMWRNSVERSLLAIENEVVGSSEQEKNTHLLLEGIKKLAEENKLPDDVTKTIKELYKDNKERENREKRYRESVKKETASERESSERAQDAIRKALEDGNKLTESEEESIKRAQGSLENIKDNTSHFNDAIKSFGNSLKDLLTSNFRKVFDQWDRQIATLKEQGMGGPNAAMLNKMTRRTMDATEQTLGWNVSIDKAIKATNSMIAAGQSPRYLRENNKQLITGLEGIGLNLQPTTIRAIGQSVFDSQQVKDLTEGWAQLISPDTEGAIKADQISSFLESDDFKKATSAMMMGGASYAKIQEEMIKQLREAVKAGVSGQDALAMALTSTQNNLGRGAVVVVPDRLSSYIGAAQIAGTYSGNVGNLTADYAAATKAYHTDANVRQRMAEASASLAQSGDFSLLENIQFNDGHTRNLATMQEIGEGQYEGLVPRITKYVAGLLPAESLGSVSQQLTGDSGFLTKQSFDLFSGLVKDFISPQTFYLRKIAKNTEDEALGTSTKGKEIGKFMKGALPLIAGLAVTAGLMYTAYSDSQAEEKAAEEARKRALESYTQEMELEKQHRDALLKGNKKLANDIDKQLRETRERTNQELTNDITLREAASDDLWKMGGAGIGGVLGAALAVGIGALLAIPTGGLSLAAGLGLAGAGLAGGAALGYGGTALATGSSGPDVSSEIGSGRAQLAQAYAQQANKNKYADGGIITKEQVATIGEGNQPEVVIPLTNPERAEELMSQAASMPTTNPDVASMMSQDAKKSMDSSKDRSALEGMSTELSKEDKAEIANTIADNMVNGAKAQFGKKYSEMVCNQMVEAAMNWAGLTPPTTGAVYHHFNSKKFHLVLNDPEHGISTSDPNLKRGMIMFSHPFTQAEADQLNREKPGNRKAGDPGHMGIYAGDGLWWNSTSSKNTTDYSSGTGVKVKDANKGYGVALTKPFTRQQDKTYYLFAAGYYDGMFDEADVKNLPTASPSVSNALMPSLSQPSPNSRGIINVKGEEKHIVNTSTMSKEDTRRIYNESVKNAKLKYTDFNSQVLSDILLAKSKDFSPEFDAKIAAHNPFGILNIDGSLKEFDDVESGIQAFISKIEAAYDKLESMDYKKQLDTIKNDHFISGYDYDRTMGIYQDRLATSIDRLNSSVQESNRLATKASMNPIPMTSIAGRRYT